MSQRIEILIGDHRLEGSLNDSNTARAISKALPFEFSGNYWGEELYGTIPVKKGEENSVEVVEERGTLAFWPVGNALCLFWGETPVSQEGEMRAASPVNVVGRITSGLEEFIQAKPDVMKIRVEAIH